jgi:ankyrin repeat protein/Cdc6-like AAA superfamily ATPase
MFSAQTLHTEEEVGFLPLTPRRFQQVTFPDAEVLEWMNSIGIPWAQQKYLGDEFGDELSESIFQDAVFKRCLCLAEKGCTLILMGKPGVGKTATIRSLIQKLDAARQKDITPESEEKKSDDNESQQNTVDEEVQANEGSQSPEAYDDEVAHDNKQNANDKDQGHPGRKAVIASFFFSAKAPNIDETQVLMHLLVQLTAQPSAMRRAHNLYAEYSKRKVAPTPQTIVEEIKSSLRDLVPACILLDALDECQSSTLSLILRYVGEIQYHCKIGVVMTNRSGSQILQWQVYNLSNINIQHLEAHKNDMRKFLTVKINALSTGNNDLSVWFKEQQVVETIIKASQGMQVQLPPIMSISMLTTSLRFLLVRLNFEFVAISEGKDTLAINLETIMQDHSDLSQRVRLDNHIYDDSTEDFERQWYRSVLSKAYERSIDRILKQDHQIKEKAQFVLGFIRDAVRPLSRQELQELLRIRYRKSMMQFQRLDEPHWDSITSACQGLVEEDELNNVSFVHQTLFEYLKTEELVEKVPDYNQELGLRSVAYLNIGSCSKGVSDTKEKLEQHIKEWPFLDYAARYWVVHFKDFERCRESSLVPITKTLFFNQVVQFLENDPRVEAAYQVALFKDLSLQTLLRHKRRSLGDPPTFLVLERKSGLSPLNPFLPNQVNGLHVASMFGLDPPLSALVAKSSPKRLNDKTSLGIAPLHAAVISRNVNIFRILVEGGAYPDCRDTFNASPLHWAIRLNCTEIALKLLNSGSLIDVNAQTSEGHVTTSEMIRMEIKLRPQSVIGSDDDITPFFAVGRRTPLISAAREGNIAVVRALLDSPRIDIHAQDTDGQTALHKAAKKGHVDVVKILTKSHIDVVKIPTKTHVGVLKILTKPRVRSRSKLHCRQKAGYTHSGQLAVPAPTNNHYLGCTALHIASAYGRSAKVVEFLARGWPELCNEPDPKGYTSLHMASLCNEDKNVAILLKMPGIDVNAQNLDGETALHVAILLDYRKIIYLLLGHKDTSVLIQNKKGVTPLHTAIEHVQVDNVKLLLERTKKRELSPYTHSLVTLAHQSGNSDVFDQIWFRSDRHVRTQFFENRGTQLPPSGPPIPYAELMAYYMLSVFLSNIR